ncbi:MAG: type IV pilus secretin PilQ [Actinomycetota bacterium]|nr:type IV pilus secretin PilQ [Actinomycetota bacterium]
MTKRAVVVFLALFFLAAPAAFAVGTAKLKGVDIKDNSVQFNIDGPFTYTIYKADPYRVIVELPGVDPGAFTGTHASKSSGLTQINISAEKGATKAEIILANPSDVKPLYKKGRFVLNVLPIATAAASPAVSNTTGQAQTAAEAGAKTGVENAAAPAPKPENLASATYISSISLKRENGNVKFVLTGNGAINPGVFSLPGRIVVDVPKVRLKAALPAVMIQPVRDIRTGSYSDKVRVVLDTTRNTKYDVLTKGDTLTLTMAAPARAEAPAAEEVAKPAAAPSASAPVTAQAPAAPKGQQRISLDFQNADIVPIFMLLGEVSGYNMVVHPSVHGTITLKLKDVPWEQALNILMDTFGLGKRVEGNVMTIAPLSQFATWDKEKQSLEEAEASTEPVVQTVIRLSYAQAADITSAISNAKLLSNRGNITQDIRTNSLIIKDTPTQIAKIEKLVKIMDVAQKQVMIEAQIVEVSSSYAKSLGIQWGGTANFGGFSNGTGGQGAQFSVNTPVLAAGPTAGTAVTPFSGASFFLGTANALSLQISLNALETVGKSRSLANPRVLTLDNQAASIQQGTSIPVQTTSASGTSTQFVNANLNLQVTPRITPDGYVLLKVTAANDSLGDLTPQGYAINRKNVTTQALVKDGETLVLGGIYTDSRSTTDTGVPFLSRIPLLNLFFKDRTETGPNPQELLILITPKIVKADRS